MEIFDFVFGTKIKNKAKYKSSIIKFFVNLLRAISFLTRGKKTHFLKQPNEEYTKRYASFQQFYDCSQFFYKYRRRLEVILFLS